MLTSTEERCGIAEYSRHLIAALREYEAKIDVIPTSFAREEPAVYAAMGRAVNVGDVAHVQHSYALFGGMDPRRYGWPHVIKQITKPLVVTVHEIDSRPRGATRLPKPIEAALKRRVNKESFAHPAIDRWIVHALTLKESLLSFGVPSGSITCRPLPIEPAPPHRVDPTPMIDVLGVQNRPTLVILGFLADRKGYDIALQALTQLPSEYMLVAAGGEHPADQTGTTKRLTEMATRMGVGPRFKVTGYLSEDELEQACAMADLVLAPFKEMSASASIGFALARGKVVIASDLAENKAMGCMALFERDNPHALAAAVRRLGEDTHERLRLAKEARDYAARRSYATFARETIELYEELARKGHHAG